MTFVAPLVSKSFPCYGCSCPERGEVGSCFLCLSGKVFHQRKNHREISWETDWERARERAGWQMTYEERGGQEKLLPSSFHHDHPGGAALRTVAVFLALIGGEMPPRGPQGSLRSREGAVQRFPTHPEPRRQGHPGLTPGPAAHHSQGQRALSVHMWRIQCRQSWTEAPELYIFKVSGPRRAAVRGPVTFSNNTLCVAKREGVHLFSVCYSIYGVCMF